LLSTKFFFFNVVEYLKKAKSYHLYTEDSPNISVIFLYFAQKLHPITMLRIQWGGRKAPIKVAKVYGTRLHRRSMREPPFSLT